MNKWLFDMLNDDVKRPMPILSFPAVQLMGINVRELTSDAHAQAGAMQTVAKRVKSAASVSLMDLSVEAEAFGSTVRFSDDEVPTVTGSIVDSQEAADALQIPEVGAARTGKYVEAIRLAKQAIKDRPVYAGVIGPYSLAGRLMDVTEIMYMLYDDPDMVHTVLNKTTEFLITYINAYKAAGADGVIMAEPLAGLLSASAAKEFSCDYVKRIIDEVQTDDFLLIYHNCGNSVNGMTNEIAGMGAAAYHFGNAVDMKEILTKMPETALCLGNINPSAMFAGGDAAGMREAVLSLLEECSMHKNFVISSGCDIPPHAKWENIDAFFAAVDEFYAKA